MKVMAFNGSPRKSWNTAKLLESALAGAASAGAETRMVQLYDLAFKGCKSSFGCKIRGGRSFGVCAMRDDLAPVLAEAATADALILGSPIYFAGVTGEMRSFMERLMFPYLQYDAAYSSLFPRKIPTAFIYTMNVPEPEVARRGYDAGMHNGEDFLRRIFGSCETLAAYDTYQFDDYAKVVADGFDAEKKAARHRDVFPKDLDRAFALGAGLARAA